MGKDDLVDISTKVFEPESINHKAGAKYRTPIKGSFKNNEKSNMFN
jgi:hypothetical protein